MTVAQAGSRQVLMRVKAPDFPATKSFKDFKSRSVIRSLGSLSICARSRRPADGQTCPHPLHQSPFLRTKESVFLELRVAAGKFLHFNKRDSRLLEPDPLGQEGPE